MNSTLHHERSPRISLQPARLRGNLRALLMSLFRAHDDTVYKNSIGLPRVRVLCAREGQVSPTVFRDKGYRFYFFSREESRKHVHVQSTEGEAKFWLEPEVVLAKNHGLSDPQLARIKTLVEEHLDELTGAWDAFFSG